MCASEEGKAEDPVAPEAAAGPPEISEEGRKRGAPEEESEEEGPMPLEGGEESDDDFGPKPEGVKKKRRKLVVNDDGIMASIPKASMYETSYMHRATVTHVAVSSRCDAIMTGSADGHVKLWHKDFKGIVGVKHFKAHMERVVDMSISPEGEYGVSIGADNGLKVYDLNIMDNTALLRLEYKIHACCIISTDVNISLLVALSRSDPCAVDIVDAFSTGETLRRVSLHRQPPHSLSVVRRLNSVISTDITGAIEIWDVDTLKFPSRADGWSADVKSDTSFYALQQAGVYAYCVGISPNDNVMGCMCSDSRLRIWRLTDGKLIRTYDESKEMHSTAQRDPKMSLLHLKHLDFGRKASTDKECGRAEGWGLQRVCFDQSSAIVIYSSIIGIKMLNWESNQLRRVIGQHEGGDRFLAIALYQGAPKRHRVEGGVAAGGSSFQTSSDQTIFCTSFNKKRFFLFSNREPSDVSDRDIINEAAQ